MPKLSATDVIKEFGTENPPQLCFICGEDVMTTEQMEKRIRKKLTDGEAMSDTVFDGQRLDFDRLADACSFCPMFQPYNLIIIRDLDLGSNEQKEAQKEKGENIPQEKMVEELLHILSELAPRVVVLVVMRAMEVYEIKNGAPSILSKYKKITTFFEKKGILCINEKKNAYALGKQIMERAKRHGSEISRKDAEMLANRCLCDSTLVNLELDKLLAYADGEAITREMLDALVAPLPDANGFQLARAVSSGNGKEAMRLLGQLTAKTSDTSTILGLLSLLSGNFTDMYRAKLGGNASKQDMDIIADFGYPKNREFVVRNAMRDCKSMTIPQLHTCIRILRETDRSCKSSRIPPKLLLEQAIVRMLRVRKDGMEGQT